MFGRNKITATRSKRTSERMRSASLGSHHASARGVSSRRSSASARNVQFSSTRKTRRAERGVVDYVRPSTYSGESSEQHSRRMGRRRFAQEAQVQSNRRRVVFILVSLLIVLAVAAIAGVTAFFGSVNSKFALDDADAKEALVAPANDTDPYYVLCVAALGAAQGSTGPETDAYLLVRVDEQSKSLAMVAIPSNLNAAMSDGEYYPLYEAVGLGGDAELINAVAKFTGVDIAHFVRTDAEGIARLVEIAGGVTVEVTEEIDDPTAGSVYMQPGVQVVDAEAALTLLRAKNFSTAPEIQAVNRVTFTAALMERLLEVKGVDFRLLLDEIAGHVKTDLSAGEISDIADALRGVTASSVHEALVPGYTATTNGVSLYYAYSSEWASMLERLEAGLDPSYVDDPSLAVDPSSFTIEIRNGADIAGAAAQMRGILEGKGFVVEAIGNVTDFTIYPETLVIYHDPSFEVAAHAVIRALDEGRTVNGGDYYAFDTDILIVLGQDWQPIV